MAEQKQPVSAVEEARRLREEAAEIRKGVAPVLEQLRKQRAAMRRALRATLDVLHMPSKKD
jgi:F0F1-type ATP synthase membrane subunit b/b'